MSVHSVDYRPCVYTRQEFEDTVRDLTSEELVVEYIRSHRLEFLQMGEAVKVRKHLKHRVIDANRGRERSNHLLYSLIVLSDGTVFRTGREKEKNYYRRSPGGREAALLGNGHFKDVFRVKDLVSGKMVAVSLARSEKFEKMLKVEYEVTQLVHSPYILPVQCYGTVETAKGTKKVYAISELCEGTLEKKGELYLREHPEILQRIANALEDCHAVGVVHNDAYPRNIFIKLNGDAVLADFGNAERFEENLLEISNIWISLSNFRKMILCYKDEIALEHLFLTFETADLSTWEAGLVEFNSFLENHHWLEMLILGYPTMMRDLKKEIKEAIRESGRVIQQ